MGRPLENFGIEGVDDLPIEATVVYSRKRSKGSVSSGRLLIFNDVSPKEAGEVISCFTDDAGLMQSADLRANTIEQINRELPASEAKVEEVKLSDSGNFVLANSDNKHICGFVYEHGGRLVLWIKVPGDSQPDMSGFGEIRSRR